jgi:hypothetical protein
VSGQFDSVLGRTLYRLLPSVYRERDNPQRDDEGRLLAPGDLARYLDAAGVLLDRVRATLDQRLADAFPDLPGDGAPGQEWLIPYFARLFDVRLVAPDVAGQRAEVANAIAWRQRKGTLLCAEQIGEAILQGEVELQEGWQRVALTPRVGRPLLPPSVFGVDRVPNPRSPLDMAHHPGLPSVTPDLRLRSRAVRTERNTPATRTSRLGGAEQRWLQAERNGAPLHPGRFDDVSRRTVDLRTPTWNAGHPHPRHLLVFTPPPQGLFAPPELRLRWEDLADAGAWVRVRYDDAEHHLHLECRSTRPVTLLGNVDLLSALSEAQRAALPDDEKGRTLPRITLDELSFEGTITLERGQVHATRVAMARLIIATNDFAAPVLVAQDCLFGALRVADGLVRMDSCTVMQDAACGALDAMNSIFADTLIGRSASTLPKIERLAHSRIAAAVAHELAKQGGVPDHCVTSPPVFFASDPAQGFGPHVAVLAPQTPASVCFGADDGAEMGFFHRGRRRRPIHLRAKQHIAQPSHDYELCDIVFEARLGVDAGALPLRLRRCAVAMLEFASALHRATLPDDLVAVDTLFDHLLAAGRPVQLEYCTVLTDTRTGRLHASDCIFAGALALAHTARTAAAESHCIRYSRVPKLPKKHPPATCTDDAPVFIESAFARGAARVAGCGVQHQAAPASIAGGAEDGGEMGACHTFGHRLQQAALRDKLADHLPVGIEAVLVLDPQMNVVPPRATE